MPVCRADIAYKAVPPVPGENVVEFTFGSAWFSVLSLTIALNAAWLLGVAATFCAIARNPAPIV